MDEVEEIVVRFVEVWDAQPVASRFARWAQYRQAKEAWEADYGEAWAALRAAARDLRRGKAG